MPRRCSWSVVFALLRECAAADLSHPSLPYQLQVNYQRAPALGVGPLLRFSWAVPAPESLQSSYELEVHNLHDSSVAWTSGSVNSTQSINVSSTPASGLAPSTLQLDSRLQWRRVVDPSTFITALWDGSILPAGFRRLNDCTAPREPASGSALVAIGRVTHCFCHSLAGAHDAGILQILH